MLTKTQFEKNVCVWYKSSTNKYTLKSDMPIECKKRGCDGLNKTCELYQNKQEYLRK